MSESGESSGVAAAKTSQPTSAPVAKGNWFTRHWIISLLGLAIGSCSFMTRDRTVSWEEEVPLNTGETIWLKRTVEYKLQGAGSNPLDLGYLPSWTEEIAFEWKGRKYKYVGDAGVMLVAISPTSLQPVLVASASIKNWDDQNHYKCTTPYYVQFNPDSSGQRWSWPPKIEPWLYGMSYNVMYHKPKLGAVKPIYTEQDRKKLDSSVAAQSQRLIYVDASYSFKQCKK